MSDEEAHDQLARLRAEMDQAREGMSELAISVFRYYSELLNSGFNSDQALTIVIAWQGAMIAARGSGDDE